MKKSIFIVIAVVFLSFGCTQQKQKNKSSRQQTTENQTNTGDSIKIVDKFPKLTPKEHFHATVNDTLTLKEVAKINGIGEPFLKTKLGIPSYLNYEYPIKQLKKNYRFTIEELKTLIEDTKNRSATLKKRKTTKK